MRRWLMPGAILAVTLGVGGALAQEPSKAPESSAPGGCAVYVTYLKAQRDTLEAHLANAVAELTALKKATEGKAPK